ncbi:hypothetical protein [Aliivibrio fischeri]|uniref:hypothetical protein n=1 Tax=Aliivibrio fischeri TaxID=668 RepID=UPI0012DABD94|nr:hypothetical protein [Aliivibrio fischeri]MUJ26305.1 hypothetical protein [Aliivibrio fischeri]
MTIKNDEMAQSYRKSVFLTASFLFVYTIAGGSIQGELSLLGATFKFSRPEYLEYLGVALVMFFTWSHWQVSDAARKELFELMYMCKNSDEIKKFSLWNWLALSVGVSEVENYSIRITNWQNTQICKIDPDTGMPEILTKKRDAKIIVLTLSTMNFISICLTNPAFRNAILPEILALISLVTYINSNYQNWVLIFT